MVVYWCLTAKLVLHLLLGDGLALRVRGDAMLESGEDGGVQWEGSGHTTSWQYGGQNSRILSKRYCFLSCDNPSGRISGGMSELVGDHLEFFGRSFSTVSVHSLTVACAFFLASKTKWWRLLMPAKAFLLKYGAKWVAQSYCGTMMVPSSFPTNWV